MKTDDVLITKRCSKCGETKPLDQFSKASHKKSGYRCKCKACDQAYQKEYRQSEKGKAYCQAYRQSEKGKACDQAYRQSEKGKAYYKVYQQEYRQSEKRKAYQKEYQQSEKRKAYQKEYRQSEKGKACQKALNQAYSQSEKGQKQLARSILIQTGFPESMITENLIDTKLLILKIKRQCKTSTNYAQV
ncbi:MAG: hypothetical protein Q8861_02175 [Bacteroidota bacterium]|nr:hypothetical protein [Bacteroidota bacterium]